MIVKVESAVELTDKQTEVLKQKIKDSYGEKTKIKFRVDSNLIGGIRIVTPKKTVDMSLAARLSQLNHALQTN